MTLAPGVLDGALVALAGRGPVADAVMLRLSSLGAEVHAPAPDVLADEEDLTAWATATPTPTPTPTATATATRSWRALVVEAGETFSRGGPHRLTATMESVWVATRAVAAGAMLAAGEPARVVFIAPAPGTGPHAGALRAALENLARTLSVEWARHQITPVAVLPGDDTSPTEIAELTSFLVSPAGAYFSGCPVRLGVIPAAA